MDPRLEAALAYRAQAAKAELAVRYVPHAPSPKQQLFLDLDCREALYGGAAGGGKSDALLMSALQYVHVPGYSAGLFRNSFTDLALPGAIMDRAREWLEPTNAHWDGQNKRWRFPGGASLAFGYLEGPDDHKRYKGAEFQFLGFDEASEIESHKMTYLFSRLRRPANSTLPIRLRSATNPGGPSHEFLMRRFAIPDHVDFNAVYRNEGRVFVPASLLDNAHIDQEEYRLALAELDPITRMQLEEGRWIQDSAGRVYPGFSERCIFDVLPPLPEGEAWTWALGADFGVSDQTALVDACFSEHEPVLYIVRNTEFQGLEQCAPSTIAAHIHEWDREQRYELKVGDFGGMGKSYQAEFQKRYLSMMPAEKQDKLGAIKLLNGDLQHGRVLIHRSCEPLIKQLTYLTWKNTAGVNRIENPAQPNHSTDAALYLFRHARHWQSEAREQSPTPQEAAQRYRNARVAAKLAAIAEREQEEGYWDGFDG